MPDVLVVPLSEIVHVDSLFINKKSWEASKPSQLWNFENIKLTPVGL
jgi:hypothetical protein